MLLLSMGFSTEVGRMSKVKKSAVEWMEKLKSEHDDVAVYIWEHPELSFVEYKSAAKLQQYLEKYGFAIETGTGGVETAFIATWGSGKPIIGFNGEYDALPNLSQEKGLAQEKAITRGAPGHGCGHNIFGASSATAAIATAMAMKEHGLEGTIRFYGTPGEEAGGGKFYMARDGAWDDCDACISWHPGSSNRVKYSSTLANQNVKVRFFGRSAHAAGSPHLGRSALDAVELLNVGMNYAREHMPDKTRIHYVITGGGEAPNNVPPYAEVWYFLRAPRRSIVDEMYSWFKEVARGAAMMTHTEVEFRIIDGLWEILPNKTLAEVGLANLRLIGPPPFTEEDQKFASRIADALKKEEIKNVEAPYFDMEIKKADLSRNFPDVATGMGSSDDGNVSWVTPMVGFGAANFVKGTIGHNWTLVTQSAMPPALKAGLTAGKWMAGTAVDLIQNPELLKQAREEHQEYLRKFPFNDLIDKNLSVPSFYDIYGREWESVPKPPTYKKE